MLLQFKLQSRIHSSKFGPVNHYRWKFNTLQKSLNELGPVWENSQNIEGNHYIHRQKNIALSYSDPGGTLGKIKQPKTLI